MKGVKTVESERKPEVLKRLSYIEGHLRSCVPEGIKGDREEEVIQELIQLYTIAGNP